MKQKKQDIEQWLKEFLKDEELFLLGFENESPNNITILIDCINGVGIDDCVKVSRYISQQIDEIWTDETAFVFDVSSPGIDSPLIDIRQYHKNINRPLEIEMIDGTKYDCVLNEVDNQSIKIEFLTKEKGKKKEIKELKIDINSIKVAKVKIVFKALEK